MKTKHRIISVLMILAIMTTLCVVMATPASAATAVTAVTWTPAPLTAGSTALQTVGFTATSGVTALVDSIYVTFPVGVTVPATMSYTAVLVNGVSLTSTQIPSVSGQRVTIPVPATAGVGAGGAVTVIFTGTANIVNPKAAASTGYKVTVSTTQDTVDATMAAAVPGTAAGTLYPDPVVSFTPTYGGLGTIITVTGMGFTPSAGVTLGGAASQLAPASVNTDGTFTATAAAVANYYVTATDGAGIAATSLAMFTLMASLTVSPTSGNAGSVVTVNISGLTTGNDYALSFGTPTVNTTTGAGILTMDSVSVGAEVNPVILGTAVKGAQPGTGGLITCMVTIPNGALTGVNIIYVKEKVGAAFGNYIDFNAALVKGQGTFTVSGPAITVSPASGPIGTMTTVSGSNFPPTGTAYVYMVDPNTLQAVGGTIAGGPMPGGALAVTTATPDGGGAFAVAFTIPAGLGVKTYGITVMVGAAKGSGSFAVTAGVLTCTPASGPRGTKVILNATGLTTGGAAYVLAANVTLNNVAGNSGTAGLTGVPATTVVDSAGNLTPINVTIGATAPLGADTVRVADSVGTTPTLTGLASSGTFTVTQPTMVLSPTSGARGETITITGAGWLPGALGLVLIQMPSGTTIGTAIPDASGNIYAQITVPVTGLNPGQVTTVKAIDASGANSALIQNFTVTQAKITIDPTTVAVGSQVTVKGFGFQPYTGVYSITIGGVQTLGGAAVVTDSTGAFTAAVTVPGVAVGGQSLIVTLGGVGGVTASSSITVTAGTASATPVATGLAPIATSLPANYAVWSFNNQTKAWGIFDSTPGAPANTLTGFVTGGVYYIEVAADCTLNHPSKPSDPLYIGWNIIPW